MRLFEVVGAGLPRTVKILMRDFVALTTAGVRNVVKFRNYKRGAADRAATIRLGLRKSSLRGDGMPDLGSQIMRPA